MKKAREASVEILLLVSSKGAYANIALNNYFKQNEVASVDKALATEIVYGTLRRRITIDYILNQYVSTGIENIPEKMREILRMTTYQLYFMDKIPVFAAIDEAVTLSKKMGFNKMSAFCNGVLRNVERGKAEFVYPNRKRRLNEYLSIYYSHPMWLVDYYLERFGEDVTESILAYNNKNPRTVLRVNSLKTTREAIMEKLAELGVQARVTEFSPYGIEVGKGAAKIISSGMIGEGLISIQHLPSQLATLALSPTAGSVVIDACAAPGGKTTFMAQLMENRGQILAFDIHAHKVELIKKSAKVQGIDIIEASQMDAKLLADKYRGKADFVLCDVPCSGLGVLAERADSRLEKKASDIKALAKIGYDILSSASQTVKNGGVLVYSTCTLSYEENEGNIRRFLKNNPEFSLDAFPNWEGKPQGSRDGIIEILPSKWGIDGFFIARLKKQN